MPDEETVADRLRTAAAYVGDNHTRNALVDDDGRVCAVGAILGLRSVDDLLDRNGPMLMLAADPIGFRAIDELSIYVDPKRPPGFTVSAVESWNDFIARDGAEVAAAMEKAAAQWEERA